MEEVRKLEKILREKGLTDRQVEAGVKYYINFASKFDIPVEKTARMVEKLITNMRKGILES